MKSAAQLTDIKFIDNSSSDVVQLHRLGQKPTLQLENYIGREARLNLPNDMLNGAQGIITGIDNSRFIPNNVIVGGLLPDPRVIACFTVVNADNGQPEQHERRVRPLDLVVLPERPKPSTKPERAFIRALR